jgi:hypothetical protein
MKPASAGGRDAMPANSAGKADLADLRAEQARVRQAVKSLWAASTETTTDIHARLEVVETQLAALKKRLDEGPGRPAAPAPASFSPEQLEDITEHVLSAMRAEVDKAAAASAAKVIREEIGAMFGSGAKNA